MSALFVHHCSCDPGVIPGIPGHPCPNCGALRAVPMTREDALRLSEEASALRHATRIVDGIASLENCSGITDEHARELIADARLFIGQADRGLEAAFAALAPDERGRPAIGLTSAHDQRPGRH